MNELKRACASDARQKKDLLAAEAAGDIRIKEEPMTPARRGAL